jgi:CubicO group peptidase (beta-lactamase class C family)
VKPLHIVAAMLVLLAAGATAPARSAHAAGHLTPAAAKDRASKPLGTRIDAYLKGLAANDQLSGAVLVARKGKVLLAGGYGMAVRESGVRNSPTTKYPLPGISFSLTLAAGLRLEDQGKLKDGASVCSYLPSCPASWKPMTVGMVLDGTSGLGDSGWGQAGHTTAQSLAQCQGELLTAAPGTRLNYANCTVMVLGIIFQKVSGTSWERFMRQEIFKPAGMKNSGRVTDALLPPARAQDYSGTEPDSDVVYNDYFQVYGTIRDVYAYDNALLGGKLLSKASLGRLFATRGSVNPPDANISDEHQASKWKVGSFLGHRLVFTTDNTKSFTGAKLRFPRGVATVIVISNDDHNDVERIAVHVAGLLFGQSIPAGSARVARAGQGVSDAGVSG